MRNAIVGILDWADDNRREFKTGVTFMILHFVGLIAGIIAIQSFFGTIDQPWTALFGLAMIAGGIMTLWVKGGRPLDAILVAYIATSWPFPKAIVRTIVGFFAVESMICTLCLALPLYVHPAVSLLLLVATGCYFLYRFMAGLVINWEAWTWIPATYIIVCALWLCVQAWAPDVVAWINSPSMPSWLG